MIISAIAAIGEKRELGKDNTLLWHIPEDFKRFKTLTSGHPIIMGRKTFESIGRILPGRTNIIITRDKNYTIDGAVVVHSLNQAIEEAKSVILSNSEGSHSKNNLSKKRDSSPEFILRNSNVVQNDKEENEIFIIGGGQIFGEAMPKLDRLYLTIVHKTFDADTFFPNYRAFKKVVEKENGQNEEFSYTFLTLER